MSPGISVNFKADFTGARSFLKLNGVRRALIAYWTEALVSLKERNASSIYAKNHNWNAVAEIRLRLITNASSP